MKNSHLSASGKLRRYVSQQRERWRQPGLHWFLLLYLLGLIAVTCIAMLLKTGMKLL